MPCGPSFAPDINFWCNSRQFGSFSLQDLYLAVLLSSKQLGVRLRPELKARENFSEEITVEEALRDGVLNDPEKMLELFTDIRAATPPESLLLRITDTLLDRYYGMEALALASIIERDKHAEKIFTLPNLPSVVSLRCGAFVLQRVNEQFGFTFGFFFTCNPNYPESECRRSSTT
jgi:hypothetical protein